MTLVGADSGAEGDEDLAGLEALAAALEVNVTVRALSVRHCSLGTASVPVLVRALQGAPQVSSPTMFDLAHSYVLNFAASS